MIAPRLSLPGPGVMGSFGAAPLGLRLTPGLELPRTAFSLKLAPASIQPVGRGAMEVPAPGTGKAVVEEPLALYRRLNSEPAQLDALSPAQRRAVWTEAFKHPVAGLDDPAKMAKYDPAGIIGFCFGRAMAVQLLARKLGLGSDSIRKLFVVGDLRSGNTPEWRFHVTTLVKSKDGEWWAIDPIMGGPISMADWIAAVRKGWDRGHKAKFYLTGADAVLPDIRVVPDPPQEKGEHLIEISFEPNRQAGFSRLASVDASLYAPDDATETKHFRIAGSDPSPFDFTGITINGGLISYNQYFVDLLAELASAGKVPPSPKGGRSPLPEGAAGPTASPASPPLGLNVGALSGGR